MKIKNFLIATLPVIWAACVWFVLDQLHDRGVWFFTALSVGVISFLCFFWLILSRKVNFSEPRQMDVPSGVWFALGIFGLAVLILSHRWEAPLLGGLGTKLLAALFFAGEGAFILELRGSKNAFGWDFAMLILGYGIVYRILGFLPEIQTGPFALGWSEGSRFYNASTFASQQLYQRQLPLPILHPSRYLMQAVPFFIGIRDILAHRIWQVLLWLGVTLWGSWLVAKRVGDNLKFPLWMLVGFIFLFFFQGAVYYHLMIVVILILLGYKRGARVRTFIFVIMASVWAGISRVNWIPVPGLLAMTLYLIDEPLKGKGWIQYLVWPAVWTIFGLATGLIAKQVYINNSGENPALFDSAFSSALLWYRLLPNSTYFLGILPAIILACFPLAVLMFTKLKNGVLRAVHWLRWLLVAGILAVFLFGGILVSLKIGGGGDLHNMDAFLVLFLVFALNLIVGNVCLDEDVEEGTSAMPEKAVWLLLALIVPIFFTFTKVGTIEFVSGRDGKSDLEQLNLAIAEARLEPGEVLFIAERQLLAFDSVECDLIVEPYEKVFLMEMAMGENQNYLNEFYLTLESGRYSMIVTDSINAAIQDRKRSFSEENNAWVRLVLEPMLEYYEPAIALQNGEVNILLPKDNDELLATLQTLGK